MKTAVITIDFTQEKATKTTIFEGKDCWKKAEDFAKSIRKDFSLSKYRTLVCRDAEANMAQAKEIFGSDNYEFVTKTTGEKNV